MGILSNIEPKEVFHYFEELSMVPRSTVHQLYFNKKCKKKSVIFVWNLQKLTIWNISRMK